MTKPTKAGRPGTVPAATVRRIRKVFEARARTPTDEQLAREHGLSPSMVRMIGTRRCYAHVPDHISDDH